MRKVMCSGYTPQSSVCNNRQQGRCPMWRCEVADTVRTDLQFRCPRKPYSGKHPTYVTWRKVI